MKFIKFLTINIAIFIVVLFLGTQMPNETKVAFGMLGGMLLTAFIFKYKF